MGVFTSVVVICTLGALTVTVQAKLLGGRVSFFQALCVLGYCIAPLDIAALVSCFVRVIYVRAPVALVGWAWSVWGAFYLLCVYCLKADDVFLSFPFRRFSIRELFGRD